MALYICGKRVKLNLNGVVCSLNLANVVTANKSLLSSDNYILKDSSGLYLVPKTDLPFNVAMSLDDRALKDLNGLYITLKEDE